jgi:hypothetical protein
MVRNPGDQNVIFLFIENPPQHFELPRAVSVSMKKYDGITLFFSVCQKNSVPIWGNILPV